MNQYSYANEYGAQGQNQAPYYHPQPSTSPSGRDYYNPQQMPFTPFTYDPQPGNSTSRSYDMFVPGNVPMAEHSMQFDDEPPLLEELGINFDHIVQKTVAVLLPLKESTHEVLSDADLAGPLVFCFIFGCTLMLAGKMHFNYIYGLGVFGCLGMYLLLTMMTPDGVTPTFIASTLGYCLLPMCALSSVGILLSLKSFLGILLTCVIVFWCTVSSSKLFVRALNMQHQRFLVGYPCALVYSVFALLVVF